MSEHFITLFDVRPGGGHRSGKISRPPACFSVLLGDASDDQTREIADPVKALVRAPYWRFRESIECS